MSQLHGKQLKGSSVVLDKLSGTGVVSFNGASMSFTEGSTLRTKINNIVVNDDVVNKEYVDSVATGLDIKQAAVAIENGTNLSLTNLATLTIDGISIGDGERVVLNAQTNKAQNGIYVYSSSAQTLTRATDFDEPEEVQGGEFVFVKKGDTYADTGWVVANPDAQATIGTSEIEFTQFSSAGVVTAGEGLDYGTGTDLYVVTGAGITISGDAVTVNPGTGLETNGTEVLISDTTVSSGSYGQADAVSTFTVNAQGQLTAAGTQSIQILSSQVTDFDADVLTSVFEDVNFVDSDTIDFTVTAGESVTADVIAGTAVGADAGGVYVKFDDNTIVLDNNGDLSVDTSSIAGAGLTGNGATLEVTAGNGLSVNDDQVELGGTLSKDTTVAGDSNSLTFNGVNVLTLDASKFNFTFGSSSLTDDSGNGLGLVYAADYSSTFVDESLVSKRYVDQEIADSQTATTYYADQGLTMSGNTFSVLVDSDALEINGSNEVSLKSTIAGSRTFTNDVTVNGDFTVNGTVSYLYTQDLLVEDNIITLNATYSGPAVAYTGIEVNVDGTNYSKLLWESATGTWVAGPSGSTTELVQFAGDGLTRTGATLSLDASFVAGAGLTTSGSSALSVVAGNGLTVDSDRVELGGTLDQFTEIDAAGFAFTLATASTITLNTAGENAGGIDLSTSQNNSDITLTTNTSNIEVNSGAALGMTATTTVTVDAGSSMTLDATTDLTVTAGETFSLSFDSSVVTDNSGGQGLVYAADYSATFVDESLITKKYVDDAVTVLNDASIDEVIAGDGLTGGGTFGNVTLAVGDGAGITVSADSIAVDITVGGGLTFSAAGTSGTLELAYDSNTLDLVDGQLTVIAGASQPVYDVLTSGGTYSGTSGAGAVTGLTLSQTPNDYSRIEVYVNGQKQTLGDGVTNTDCWFGASGTSTSLATLVAGAELVWNAQVAGFDLEESDKVEIVYEA